MKRVLVAPLFLISMSCGAEPESPRIETLSVLQGRALEDQAEPPEADRDTEPPAEDGRDTPSTPRALCGLFRGGLDEGTHMIASPNPPESIEDTDAACIDYCDLSGWQVGDLCLRGGLQIKLYSEAPLAAPERG